MKPDAVVIVATIRALKYNGGVSKDQLNEENIKALEAGLPNLLKHIRNITEVFHLPAVVAINRFPTDTEEEIRLVREKCRELGVNIVLSEVWAKGGEGGIELAEEVLRLTEQPSKLTYAYDLSDDITEKIQKIATKIYGAAEVTFSTKAKREIARLEEAGYGNLPVCMAKNQYSLTDDPKKLGCPTGFEIKVRNVTPSIGAGFLVVLTGTIMKMPGLPKVPSAEQIDVDEKGQIHGLF